MGEFEMMKKTTSALAVAALLGTGAASAATFQVNDDTTINIGGDFQMAYSSTTDRSGTDQTGFVDNGTSLVFSGEHAADNGLTTFFNLDLDGFDMTEADANSQGNVVDEASVGVRGAFGEIRVGSDIGIYDNYADFGDIEWIGNRTSFSNADVSDVVQYSNTVGAVDFTLQARVGDQSSEAATTDLNANPTATAAQIDDVTDAAAGESSTSLGAGASIDLGGVTLSGAYEEDNNDDEDAIFGIGAMATLGGVDFTVGYEEDQVEANSIDKVVLNAAYTIDAITVTGSVQNVSFDSIPNNEAVGDDGRLENTEDSESNINQDDDSFTETYLSVAYSMTPQVTLWAEAVRNDRMNDEGDYNAVGLYYAW